MMSLLFGLFVIIFLGTRVFTIPKEVWKKEKLTGRLTYLSFTLMLVTFVILVIAMIMYNVYWQTWSDAFLWTAFGVNSFFVLTSVIALIAMQIKANSDEDDSIDQ